MTDCVRCYRPVADTGYCESVIIRFWRYVRIAPEGCWSWATTQNERGYGRLHHGSGSVYAHRVSWAIHRGPIPDGLVVMHSCDNPPCCNPDHLRLGTNLDNMADAARKGRLDGRPNKARGEAVSNSKLTAPQVREIRRRRASGEPRRAIAAEFGISVKRVSEITTDKAWQDA